MTINYSSELMKNQKQAVVMAPDPQFEVLQTLEGNSLFFSIGTDNVFYCTREVPANTQGWTKTDLSSVLSSAYNNAAITAKIFRLFQNLAAGTIDMALVITVNGSDYLYLSLGNADTDATWAATPTWTVVPYDDTSNPVSPLTITDLYIASSQGVEYIMADRLTDPSNALNLITRYYIDPTKTITGNAWNEHSLPANVEAGTISNCIGRKSGQQVDGIYTMGTIASTAELFYTPLYNPFNPNNAPSPTYFTLPAGATAMAVSYNSSGNTDLYVAAAGSLYFLASASQTNLASLTQVYTHTLLSNVQKLFVNNAGTQTIIWGLNQQNQVFYLSVSQGSETSSSAWSYPVPILSNVMGVSTFVNSANNNNVIFAHVQDPVKGDELVQLIQDPVTTSWQSRYIVLPATATNDIIESHTYTTRIQLVGDNNLILPGLTASITGTSPCSVYINNQYCTLSATVPLSVQSDAGSIITIVQEVNSLGAVCYNVQSGGQQVTINPMSVPIARLQGTVNLSVNVTDEHGNSQPLVSSTVSSADQAAVAQAITQFVQISATMPQDGTMAGGNTYSLARKAMGTAVVQPFGLNFSNGSISSYNGGDTSNAIESVAGDIWRWIKDAVEDVDNFFVQVIGDVTHFFVTIGEAVYHFTLQCVSDVMHGIDFVLRKIGLAIEDMIKWIGFIFNWSDIVFTHKVLRNVLLQYVNQCVNNIPNTITAIKQAFQDLETNINNWIGLPNITTTYSSASASASLPPGSDSPQAHWGVYQTQNNVTSANADLPDANTPEPGIAGVLQDLLNGIEAEKDSLAWVFDEIQALVQDIPALSITDVIKRFIAILIDALLSTAENIITTLISVFTSLVEGYIGVLTTTIHIPVISHLYKKFAGEDLSLFDLIMLVTAIPVTVVFKIMTNAAPFENDAVSNGIINATDFATIQQLCAQNNNPSAASSPVLVGHPSIVGLNPPTLNTIYDKLAFAGNILAAVGALAQAVLTPIKLKYPENYFVNTVTAVFYVPYVAPDIMGSIPAQLNHKWYAVFNQICADAGILKAVADAVFSKKAGFGVTWIAISPWADFALNIIWQVPTTGAMFDPANNNLSSLFSFIGGSFFDMSGIMSPGLSFDDEPLTTGVFAILISGCNVEYGAATMFSSFV